MSTDKKLISIVIVNYKVPQCLQEALRSLRQAELYGRSEVIVVDNASGDDSKKIVTSEFPEVQWVQLKSNIGFGKACNVGVRHASGQYLLFLNPDTVISSNTLTSAVQFMKQHPQTGLLGPKILNPDGTLQLSCRRSFPTPSVAFYYFSGLSSLFPKSKRFGRYNLTYMDENETAQVDAISGSFMFMRVDLFREIGGFDERFFMYGEDIDLCFRIRQKGYQIWYHPRVQIIHLKGKSSKKRQIRSRIYFYEAMIIFTRKYRAVQGGFFPSWFVAFGILLQATLNIGATLLRSFAACLIDLAVLNASLWGALVLRFSFEGQASLYSTGPFKSLLGMHLLLSFIFVFMFFYNGIYSVKDYSRKNALLSGLLSSAIFISGVYFLSPFSRIAFGLSSLGATLLLVGWREVLPKVAHRLRNVIFAPERLLVVGNGMVAQQLIRNIEGNRNVQIVGVLKQPGNAMEGEVEGYPVLGYVEDLMKVLEYNEVDALLIASSQPWYSRIIEAISLPKNRNLQIRWVPQDFTGFKESRSEKKVPVHNFSMF
ncbi:MAG: glycosyltransferase [Chitinispirillaceae bacterium]